MVNRKYWIAMFSQTGSEIAAIATRLGFKPDLVLTNNTDTETWHPYIYECAIIADSHDKLMDYFMQLDDSNYFITLHGYLRIIPQAVVKKFELYNGHPGLITNYPELRGKDPQEAVAKNLALYKHIGSVVHKVAPEVDSGEIITKFAVFNSCNTKEEVYDTLKLTSLHSWLLFFKEKFGCELV
jgi:folate-dependent phosphoribosylglycinamide formyltransferase PurN